MFADNQENKPEPAPASTAPALASLLSTPRMSFSFPDMSSLDSNGGTPRLHPVGTSHGQLQPHQEAAADTNGHVADTTFSRELTNCHAQTDNAQTAAAQKVGKQAADPEVDYQSWPVKELRRFLSERGVVSHCLMSACGQHEAIQSSGRCL